MRSLEPLEQEAWAESDSPFLAHLACKLCWPEEAGETRGLCGYPLLGIEASWDDPLCVVCAEMYDEHVMEHVMRGEHITPPAG